MSGKHVAKNQPSSFAFTDENKKKIEEVLKKYPENKKKSAVMPLLYIAQRQNNNWIPLAAIQLIADMLGITYIKVYEVATFYTMYNLAPVGKYFVQVCTTTPCMIRGSGKVVEVCVGLVNPSAAIVDSISGASFASLNQVSAGAVSVQSLPSPSTTVTA